MIYRSAEILREFGEQFGNVRAANVMRDGPKGKSRGFGFITFADKTSRDNALTKSERVLEGRTVRVCLPLFTFTSSLNNNTAFGLASG